MGTNSQQPACKRCQQIFLATFKNLCIIHRIDSLVTCRSSAERTPEPLWERASSKLGCPAAAGSYAATKPKARFHKGFLLSAVYLVSGIYPHKGDGLGRKQVDVAIVERIERVVPKSLTTTVLTRDESAKKFSWRNGGT